MFPLSMGGPTCISVRCEVNGSDGPEALASVTMSIMLLLHVSSMICNLVNIVPGECARSYLEIVAESILLCINAPTVSSKGS